VQHKALALCICKYNCLVWTLIINKLFVVSRILDVILLFVLGMFESILYLVQAEVTIKYDCCVGSFFTSQCYKSYTGATLVRADCLQPLGSNLAIYSHSSSLFPILFEVCTIYRCGRVVAIFMTCFPVSVYCLDSLTSI
jgi:hypothetical protein